VNNRDDSYISDKTVVGLRLAFAASKDILMGEAMLLKSPSLVFVQGVAASGCQFVHSRNVDQKIHGYK